MHQRLTCTQMQIKRIQRLCAGISFQGQSSITPTWIFPGGVSQRDLHRSLPGRLMRCTFIRGKYLVLIVGSLRYFGATSHGSTGVEGPRTVPLVWQPSCQSTPEFRSMPYGKRRIRRVRTHGILPSLSAPEVVLPLLPSVCLVHSCCVVAAIY